MLLIVDESEAEHVVKRAKDFGIEAQVTGTITKETSPQVSIVSKYTAGKTLTYEL